MNNGACYDVVVIGGGPAGAAAALSLAHMGRSVAMLERSCYEAPRIGETVPPSIQPLLGASEFGSNSYKTGTPRPMESSRSGEVRILPRRTLSSTPTGAAGTSTAHDSTLDSRNPQKLREFLSSGVVLSNPVTGLDPEIGW